MKQLLIVAAVLAAGILIPQAQGSNIVVTWTGTVVNGIDNTNVFGFGLNSDLTGKNFTATYLVDPTIGFIQQSPGFFDTRGGTDISGFPSSPLLQASLTINGITFAYSSSKFGGYQRDATPGRSGIYTEANAARGPAVDILFLTVFRFDNSIPFTGLDEILSLGISSGGRGVFQAFNSDGTVGFFSGNFNPTMVTIAPQAATSPVPEPTSGVLLVSGLTGVALLRLRRRK